MLTLDIAQALQKSCFVETLPVHNRMFRRTMGLGDVAVEAAQTMSEGVYVLAVPDNKTEVQWLIPGHLLAELSRMFEKIDNPLSRGQ
jgi:hypothetical protein